MFYCLLFRPFTHVPPRDLVVRGSAVLVRFGGDIFSLNDDRWDNSNASQKMLMSYIFKRMMMVGQGEFLIVKF